MTQKLVHVPRLKQSKMQLKKALNKTDKKKTRRNPILSENLPRMQLLR
jgi:hypothetical protein